MKAIMPDLILYSERFFNPLSLKTEKRLFSGRFFQHDNDYITQLATDKTLVISLLPVSKLLSYNYIIYQLLNGSACTIELWTNLGGLLSSEEAIVFCDSYASIALSDFPRASISYFFRIISWNLIIVPPSYQGNTLGQLTFRFSLNLSGNNQYEI